MKNQIQQHLKLEIRKKDENSFDHCQMISWFLFECPFLEKYNFHYIVLLEDVTNRKVMLFRSGSSNFTGIMYEKVSFTKHITERAL